MCRPAGEGRREHDVLPGQNASVVTVAVGHLLDDRAARGGIRRHPVRGDVLPLVGVLDEGGATRLVLAVRQTANEHAAGQRVETVGADHPAGGLDEVVDRLHQALHGGMVPQDVPDLEALLQARAQRAGLA
jgi:hypothetical protein